METVNIHDATARLSELVDKAASGEDVVVSRDGKPLVRITSFEGQKRRVRFGVLKGKLRIPADFDAPLPEDVGSSFTGGTTILSIGSSSPRRSPSRSGS